MSSSTQSPDPWPPEAPQPTPESAGARDGSEFLSEASPEFKAVRRAITEAPPAPSPSPQTLLVATARDLPAPGDGARDLRPALAVALVVIAVAAGAALWWWATRSAPALSSAATARDVIDPTSAGGAAFDGRRASSVGRGGSDATPAAAPAPAVSAPPPVQGAPQLSRPVQPPPPPSPSAARPQATTAPTREVVPTGGWVTFTSPVELQIFEGGRQIGTTASGRLSLAAGRHELVLVSDAFEVRTTVTSVVADRRVTSVPVTLPTGLLSINALPWAEVWVDDRPLGSTPLANVEIPVGDHEVVWRHPDLGERRQTVRVGAGTPARVGVDLSR